MHILSSQRRHRSFQIKCPTKPGNPVALYRDAVKSQNLHPQYARPRVSFGVQVTQRGAARQSQQQAQLSRCRWPPQRQCSTASSTAPSNFSAWRLRWRLCAAQTVLQSQPTFLHTTNAQGRVNTTYLTTANLRFMNACMHARDKTPSRIWRMATNEYIRDGGEVRTHQ